MDSSSTSSLLRADRSDATELAAAVNTVSAKVFCFDGDASLPLPRRQQQQRRMMSLSSSSAAPGGIAVPSGCLRDQGDRGGGNDDDETCVWEMRVRVAPSARGALVNVFDRCDFPGTWLLHPERVDDWYTAALCGRRTSERPTTPLAPVRYHRLDVQVVGDSRFCWRSRACAFDIELLARDARSMYLLDDARLLRNKAAHRGDPFSYVAHRITSRCFCLLRSEFNGDGANGLAERVARAYDLVAHSGWRMDVANGVTSWLLCRWWLMCHPSDMVRLMFGVPPGMRVPIDGGGIDVENGRTVRRAYGCPLCHEAFAPADVVARLSCGHVFHCRCRGGSGINAASALPPPAAHKDGLLRWIEQGRTDCPMCRAAIHG